MQMAYCASLKVLAEGSMYTSKGLIASIRISPRYTVFSIGWILNFCSSPRNTSLSVSSTIGLPWGSSMVPEIVPLVTCPKATAPHNRTQARVKNIVHFINLISVLLVCFVTTRYQVSNQSAIFLLVRRYFRAYAWPVSLRV